MNNFDYTNEIILEHKLELVNGVLDMFCSFWLNKFMDLIKSLHPTQTKLIDILKKNYFGPLTIRRLQELLECSSTSVVAHHLNQLEKKGYLKRNPNYNRDYVVIDGNPETPIAYLNLYGLAQCGPNGTILDGNPIDRLPISSRIINFPVSEAFIVKAKGDSMEPKIFEGDLLITKRTKEITSGMVYVCVNNGKALVKRVLNNDGKITLLSYNDRYKPIIASEDFNIEGVVRGIISNKI